MTDNPSAGHVDLDVLAEVDEGVAGPQVEQAVRAHLEQCATCRERVAHLRTTRALLSSLPAEAMPVAVQTRVDAALDRAAAEPAGTVVPLSRRSRWWSSPAVAGGVAAAAVVVLVGALVVGHVVRHAHNKSDTASAPLAGGAADQRAGNGTATIKEWFTGANYTPATIPALAPRLVTGTPPASQTSGGGTTTPGPASANGQTTAAPATASQPAAITREQMQADPAAVIACGTILAGGVPTVPDAVDFASYQGKPAVIFVLPTAGHPGLLDVWVVRSTCSASNLDVYFRRIPRPTG